VRSHQVSIGEKITPEGVRRVNEAEAFMKGLNFKLVRVRVHGDIARIEVGPTEVTKIADGETRSLIVDRLRRLGFEKITLDLEGYRMGSMETTRSTAQRNSH